MIRHLDLLHSQMMHWNANPADGGMTIMTVGELEEILNDDPNNKARGVQYNFFSNLSNNVQEDLNENTVTIPNYPNSPNTAFLLADVAALSFDSDIISAEATIRHNGIAKNNFLYPGSSQIGSSQIGISQVGTNHISRGEISINQLGVGKVSSTQAGKTKIDFSTIGSTEVSIGKVGLPERSSTEVGSAQINSLHIGFTQIAVTQVNTTQVNISHFTPNQLSSSKISLPRSIPSEQFFNFYIHSSSPTSVYTTNNTAINLWDDLLNLQTSFSVNLSVKNLPTGQLAEAQITSFDASGMPSAGTIFIDDDANGKGWFIDSTPLDNSEFASIAILSDANTSQPFGEKTLNLLSTVQAITSEIGTISLNGDFAGEYSYSHNHQIVSVAASTKESALKQALQASGMLEISQLNGFLSDRQYIQDWYFDYETDEIYQNYEKINQFLMQTFSQVFMYRFSFWTVEKIYIVGKTSGGDWAGVYIDSQFVYNP